MHFVFVVTFFINFIPLSSDLPKNHPTYSFTMVVVTPTKKAKILMWMEAGVTPAEMARRLGIQHPSTVQRACKHLMLQGPNPDVYETSKIPGRPRKLTEKDEKLAELTIR